MKQTKEQSKIGALINKEHHEDLKKLCERYGFTMTFLINKFIGEGIEKITEELNRIN